MTGGYDQIFGGTAIYPSNQTYSTIALNGTVQLVWPIESVASETIVTDLIDVTPASPGGFNLVLPDATGGSTGVTMIINNLSNSFGFTVVDNLNNPVITINPGTTWLLYLTDNSDPQGDWNTFQYGAQAGSINVAAIAGAGLYAIGSSLNQSMPVSAKTSNYSVATTDRATVILWQGAAGTVTLPNSAAAGNNWFVNIVNRGTADITVTAVSGLIDGATTKTFSAGTGSAIVFTDGLNYYTLGYGVSGTSTGFDYTTIDVSGNDGTNGQYQLSAGQLNRISYLVTGTLNGTRTIIVPTTVQQYWINNQTQNAAPPNQGPWTLTIKTAAGSGVTVSQPGQMIMYCDGSKVIPGVSGIALPLVIGSGGTGATTAAQAVTNLGASTLGAQLFGVASAQAARVLLGSTASTIGDNLFLSTTVNAALTLLAGGTMTGTLSVTGAFGAASVTVTGTALPTNGIFINGSGNRLGFATGGVLAGYFDTTQNLNLTHALTVGMGGTGATTVAGAATNLGDPTATANSLAQRDSGGHLFATFFNMSGAVDNVTANTNLLFDDGDGYLRRASIAHVSSNLSVPSLSTATGSPGPPSYSARAWGRVNSAGTLLEGQNIASAGRSSTGVFFVTFTTAMSDTSYAVIATAQHVSGNFIVSAHEAENAVVAKTVSQVGFQIINAGGALDANFSFVIFN